MPEEGHPGQVIEDRYTLVSQLGTGAYGEVWVAHDRILGERVAFKWMRIAYAKMQARVRREITTLRTLRFPGIVRLIDEGEADNRPFLVMDLIDGRPFPGTKNGRSSWETIAETTVALLETLAHVHAAGVVHRDLKPDNVLVRDDGRPVILDFGVSFFQTTSTNRLTSQGQIVGTPLYLAPEQILDNPVDARTDLYAIGVMLYEALSGHVPHDAKDVYSMVLKRLGGPPSPILEFEPTLPPDIAAVIDRLLSIRPEDRFSSATEVIAAFRGRSPNTTTNWVGNATNLDESQLAQFFTGPDRLFHLREDAARILFERTRGDVHFVESELEQWVRIGLARRNGSLFAVDRSSLDRFVVGLMGKPKERRRDILDAAFVADEIRESIEKARGLAIQGDLGSATMMLGEALRLARAEGAVAEERDVLIMWTKVALGEATPRSLDGVLYELVRSTHRNAEMDRLQALVRAALAAPGAHGFQALEMADDLGRFADAELERARQRIRLMAVATRASPALLAEVLEEIDEWAEESGDRFAESCAAEGHARRRYHEGRFIEAAKLHAKAAALDPWMTGRIESMLRSASALLEAFEHEDAEKAANEGRILAQRARHPYWEGRAEWLIRSAQYRMGKTREPDMELIDAVVHVGAKDLEALVCLNESAIAKRADMLDVARDLADRAATIWREMGRPYATMLARALAISCGASTDPSEIEMLIQRAVTCKGPGIGIQALGLLAKVFPEKRSSWQHALPTLVTGVPETHWNRRMDVLSMNEALESARIDPLAT